VRISLHMIVRNAESKLGRTLNSVKSFVDEMIIVDTGSTDGTKAVAEMYGAQVFDYEWNDDFSAARNYALSKTTGDWVTWFDAGDVLTPESIARFEWIREQPVMTDPNSTVNYIVGFLNRNYDEFGNVYTLHATPRLIRKSADPNWIMPIHEAPVVGEPISHVERGLIVDDPEGQLSVATDRNLRIIEKYLAINDVNHDRYKYLRARELELLERYEEAVVDADKIGELELDSGSAGDYYLVVGRSFGKLGIVEKQKEMLLKASAHLPELPTPFFLLGEIEYEVGNWRKAIPFYQAASGDNRKQPAWVAIVPHHTYQPLERLANCYLALGEMDLANQFFALAIAEAPPGVRERIIASVPKSEGK